MHRLRRLLKPALIVVAVLAIAVPVAAQTSQNKPGSGLSIDHLHNLLTVDPGKSQTFVINIKNITAGPILAKAYVNDFTSDNTTGNPVIVTDPNKKLTTSIRGFVSGLQDVQLAVGEQKKVTITVSVPANATPGAYYGIIRFQAIPVNANQTPENGQVSLSASVGTIVLVQVQGDLVQKMQLLGINVYAGDHPGSVFISRPDQIGIKLKNLGNAFTQPFGRITVEKTGGKEVYSYELNNVNPRSTVLPSTSREFKDKIKGVSQPGRYKVSASVSYGNGSDVLVLQKTFWYIPAWIAGVVAAILVILIIATILAFRRYSRSRRRLKRLSQGRL